MSVHELSVVVSKEHAELLHKAVDEAIDAQYTLTKKLIRLEDIVAAIGLAPAVKPPCDLLTNSSTTNPTFGEAQT